MAAASQAKPVPVQERLFSLVLALLASESGLSKRDIFETVQGYRQRFEGGSEHSALERLFERDKDELRELGVPLETIADPREPGNTQAIKYRVTRDAYELPPELRFTPEESALLGLAALVWREGALSAESRRAMLKLRGASPVEVRPLLGVQPRVRVRDPAFAPLSQALERGVRVRFAYLKPGESSARMREVTPLALVQFQGRWHLWARDDGDGVTKTFLLRRIVGQPQLLRPAAIPSGDHAKAALAALEARWREHTALLRLAPGSDAALRWSHHRDAETDDDGVTRMHYVDLAILADELAGFGPEIEVLEPAELRDAVIARLTETARQHG